MNKQTAIERAVDLFGLTNDPREAGYILPDGSLLDFSGSRLGNDDGGRAEDHRAIIEIYSRMHSGTDAVTRFMKEEGAIRLNVSRGFSINIDFIKPITQLQGQEKQIVLLNTVSDYGSGNIKSLVNWYKKFGFREKESGVLLWIPVSKNPTIYASIRQLIRPLTKIQLQALAELTTGLCSGTRDELIASIASYYQALAIQGQITEGGIEDLLDEASRLVLYVSKEK